MLTEIEKTIKQINNSIKQLEWTKRSLSQLGSYFNYVEVIQGQIDTLIGMKIILEKGKINLKNKEK